MNAKERREAKLASGVHTCSGCHCTKPLSEFSTGKKLRDGSARYNYCRECAREYSRKDRLKRNFNLTVEDYEEILKHQKGVCAICGHPPRSKRLNVDHNHRTGKIRGLLCPFCNRALGLFRDDDSRIEALYKYIMVSCPATEALGSERFGIKGRVDNKAKTKRRLNASGHQSIFKEKE